MEKLYTCADIAIRFGVHIETVYRWIRSGQLSAISVGKGRYWVREIDLIDFENTHMTVHENG